MQKKINTYTMSVCAVLIAVGLVLPFVTGHIPAIAKIISPMHIPVFICGLTCGALPGLVVGIITPILRCLLFGMPSVINCIPMVFELAVYAAVCGLIYPRLRRRKNDYLSILIAMLCAMLLGRIVGGAAMAVVLGVTGGSYSFNTFLTVYFVNSAPGALIHLLIVPPTVAALERAKLSPLVR